MNTKDEQSTNSPTEVDSLLRNIEQVIAQEVTKLDNENIKKRIKRKLIMHNDPRGSIKDQIFENMVEIALTSVKLITKDPLNFTHVLVKHALEEDLHTFAEHHNINLQERRKLLPKYADVKGHIIFVEEFMGLDPETNNKQYTYWVNYIANYLRV
jgi:hypothetical protein